MRQSGARLNWLAVVVTVVLAVPSLAADSGAPRVSGARDLAADGELARQQQLAILLEFASEECPYCRLLEEEFLHPMLRSGEYAGKVLMRTVDVDRALPLIDFSGRRTSSSELAERYDISLTPTVVLVNGSGAPLTAPLVGIWSLDFFGGILDGRIESALLALQHESPAAMSEPAFGKGR